MKPRYQRIYWQSLPKDVQEWFALIICGRWPFPRVRGWITYGKFIMNRYDEWYVLGNVTNNDPRAHLIGN